MRALQRTILLVCLVSPAIAQVDSWSPVVTDGRGNPQNFAVIEFEVFRGAIYAATSRKGPGSAELWRSESGDPGTWEPVAYDPSVPTYKGIPSMGTYEAAGVSYLWIAVSNPPEGGTVVYRTEDGDSWIQISRHGFGTPTNFVPAPNMVVFAGETDDEPRLYAAGSSHGGRSAAEVWRTPFANTDTTAWELLIDFDERDPTVTQVTYFYIWQDELYVGTNGDTLLYESRNGRDFRGNMGVVAGFEPTDLLIASLADYGGYLYATTNNRALGGQLWRTADGGVWTNLTGSIPGHRVWHEELHNLDVSNGHLWVTAYTDTAHSSGIPVWRTNGIAGTTFVQSNRDGFGDPAIDGENPVTIGFQGRQYCGAPNYAAGGQIWRTQVFPDDDTSTGVDGEEGTLPEGFAVRQSYPNPFNGATTIAYDVPVRSRVALRVYDLLGQLVATLVDGDVAAGSYRAVWRGPAASGVFLYRLEVLPAGGARPVFSAMRKAVVLR